MLFATKNKNRGLLIRTGHEIYLSGAKVFNWCREHKHFKDISLDGEVSTTLRGRAHNIYGPAVIRMNGQYIVYFLNASPYLKDVWERKKFKFKE